MKRDFAPAADRLRSVIARLKATPAMFAALRANVDNPPREFTDLAIRMGEGSVGFYRDTVHAWAKRPPARTPTLLKDVRRRQRRRREVADRDGRLDEEGPAAEARRASTRFGAETFARQLLYEETGGHPARQAAGDRRGQPQARSGAFRAVAREDRREQDARRGDEVALRRPPDRGRPDPVGPADDREGPQVPGRQEDRHASRPRCGRPSQETPPYARDGSFASMDTPGAYETKATEAFYYVTPPEKDWDAKHKEEHLRLFNAPVMQIITIHEAFPGHYIQFLYAKQYPTKTRKLTYCGSNVEGWAHYCEQMMVEEGYGDGDPKIRLAQLSEALLRDCRFVVGIKLHTQGMTVEEGAKFFEKEGFQEPATAYEEAAPRRLQPDVPLLHAGQAADLQAARRLPQGEGEGLHAGDVPQRVRAAGRHSDQADPPDHAARRQGADAVSRKPGRSAADREAEHQERNTRLRVGPKPRGRLTEVRYAHIQKNEALSKQVQPYSWTAHWESPCLPVPPAKSQVWAAAALTLRRSAKNKRDGSKTHAKPRESHPRNTLPSPFLRSDSHFAGKYS